MSPSVPPGTLFTLLVATPSLLTFLVGKWIFLPAASPRSIVRDFLHTDWKYLGVAWGTTYVVNTLAMHFHVSNTFTSTIYDIEGATVAAFQGTTATPLTVLFTGIYLVGFPFVVLFTYFKLKAHDPEEAFRYALAYVLLVVLAVPFFILFPVKITSLYLYQVEPLMYELSPVIQQGIYATDTLVKAFPSLHAGLSVLAALYARKADAAYAATVAVLALAIVLSTLYLGIHWLTDLVFAVVLVAPAYYVSRRIEDPVRLLSPRLPSLSLRRVRRFY
jgi:membrane-associated phospholipid phosphatase